MLGWIMYFLAFLTYSYAPLTMYWLIPMVIGIIFHIKWWAIGIAAFFVGAGWKKPL